MYKIKDDTQMTIINKLLVAEFSCSNRLKGKTLGQGRVPACPHIKSWRLWSQDL